MVSPETTNWIYDYGLIEDISVPDLNFAAPTSGFSWSMPLPLNASLSNPSVEIEGSFGEADGQKENGSRKRYITTFPDNYNACILTIDHVIIFHQQSEPFTGSFPSPTRCLSWQPTLTPTHCVLVISQ